MSFRHRRSIPSRS